MENNTEVKTEIDPALACKSEVKYAGFGLRFLALILDLLVICIFFYLLNIVFSFSEIEQSILPMEMTGKDWLILGSFVLPVIAYLVLMVGKFGATLGKMALGLKVVREDLKEVSYGTAVIREFLVKTLLYFILFFLLFTSLLGYLWAIWDKRKQAWHDKIAKTLVIIE